MQPCRGGSCPLVQLDGTGLAPRYLLRTCTCGCGLQQPRGAARVCLYLLIDKKRYRISPTLLSNNKAMARKNVEYKYYPKYYAASLNIGPPTKPLTFRDHTLFFSASQCRYKIKRLCNASRCGCCLLLFFFRLGCCLLFYFEWKFVVYCYVLCHQKVAGRLPAKG